MPLPTYDKTKRRKSYTALPKAAYVIKIMGAKEEPNKNNPGSHLTIAFDIAEGEYTGFYDEQYKASSDENKKWPNDAVFRLTVPSDGCQSFIWDNWNSFFADLEDSNNGYVFDGNPASLKGKLIGGKMHIEQSEFRGNVYDHTRLKWTCVADDVRNGKAGQLPKDKLIESVPGRRPAGSAPDTGDEFLNIPPGIEEELPF